METLVCKNCGQLDTDTPFFYSAVCSVDGNTAVLADKNGNATNRFLDGTVGVSQEEVDNLDSHGYDCLHCVECGETPVFEGLA